VQRLYRLERGNTLPQVSSSNRLHHDLHGVAPHGLPDTNYNNDPDSRVHHTFSGSNLPHQCWQSDWTRHHCVTTTKIHTDHSLLLASCLHCIRHQDSATYSLLQRSLRNGSAPDIAVFNKCPDFHSRSGLTSKYHPTQDASAANQSGSGQWLAPMTKNERDIDRRHNKQRLVVTKNGCYNTLISVTNHIKHTRLNQAVKFCYITKPSVISLVVFSFKYTKYGFHPSWTKLLTNATPSLYDLAFLQSHWSVTDIVFTTISSQTKQH